MISETVRRIVARRLVQQLSVIGCGLQAEADCEQNSASAIFIWTGPSPPRDGPHSSAVLTQSPALNHRDQFKPPLISTYNNVVKKKHVKVNELCCHISASYTRINREIVPRYSLIHPCHCNTEITHRINHVLYVTYCCGRKTLRCFCPPVFLLFI